MSGTVTLTLRALPERTVEADCLVPDRLASLSSAEIARLPLRDGSRQLAVGDLFDVRGERSAQVRLVGDLARFDALGAGMTGGTLTIEGSVGRYAATRMAGGLATILGDAGSGAGLEMRGGVLDIHGSAGDRVGAARLGASKGMTGGEIIVRGAAGAEAGAGLRRGTIACGAAGARAGQGMIAGNVIVLGTLGADPGRYNKRGSIVALAGADIPATYRHACTFRPPHLALQLASLRARFALPVRDDQLHGRYDRWSGDCSELGRGEILVWKDSA